MLQFGYAFVWLTLCLSAAAANENVLAQITPSETTKGQTTKGAGAAGPVASANVLPKARPLSGVRSWGYQLQRVSPAEIAASPFDLVVIDYSRNGIDSGRYTPGEVQAMQRKPDGGRRIVLAYMSIGEAEDYRFYWQNSWVERTPLKRGLPPPMPTSPAQSPGGQVPPLSAPSSATSPPTVAPAEPVRTPRLTAPGWLARENEIWAGNFHVRFWYDGWQNIIIHDDRSYLTRIIEAGFDGVYLDRIDVYYAIERDWSHAGELMADFVIEIGKVARARKPGFIVVAQNAEELLDNPRYVAGIDGIAKEDLLFGGDGDGLPNTTEQVSRATSQLRKAQAAGLPVLVVEYLDRPDQRVSAASTLAGLGMTWYFGTRRLDRLIVP